MREGRGEKSRAENGRASLAREKSSREPRFLCAMQQSVHTHRDRQERTVFLEREALQCCLLL